MQAKIFDLQIKVYTLLWNAILDVINNFKNQLTNTENIRLHFKATQHRSKLTRANTVMRKRKNIEERGFDTNAYVNYRQSRTKNRQPRSLQK